MRNINKIFMSAAACLLLFASLLAVTACVGETEGAISEQTTQDETTATVTDTEINYDEVNVAEHVGSVTYTGHKVMLESEDASKEDALWKAILATAQISSYPEDKVEYFFRQTKEAYMYLVNGNEEDYELLLKNRGTDEAKLREEARELVKKDLVYYYIVRRENISLTETEKSELFDKYVDKYVTAYGYNRDYVVGNMTGIIYDSMLYDKTMEYLIKNNTFEVAAESSETAE